MVLRNFIFYTAIYLVTEPCLTWNMTQIIRKLKSLFYSLCSSGIEMVIYVLLILFRNNPFYSLKLVHTSELLSNCSFIEGVSTFFYSLADII